MEEKIRNIRKSFNNEIEKVLDNISLEEIRIKYFGKKSEVSGIQSNLKTLSDDEKKSIGALLNELKLEIGNRLNELKSKFDEELLNSKLNEDKIDVSLPGTSISDGSIHPISKVIDEVESLFVSMGYDVVDGPEVEEDRFNFEYLNIPKGHPTRDAQDSFFINEEWLLRTQTSPVQARVMQSKEEKGPIKIICPGKVYRKDNDDATHSHQFTQIEGLVIGENISMSDLKGTLEVFAKSMFGKTREIRFRPSYFPFTEPSIEVDVSCFNCDKKGCPICKNTGWIEILGAGMVHPNVLNMSGYDSNKYNGFAFGMGAERIAMLKYGIPDVRMFYTNDIRFVKQFNRIEGEFK